MTTKTCEHIKDDGIRCGSPAVRGRAFCYFHDRLYRRHTIPHNAPCRIPRIRNQRDLAVAFREILQRHDSDRYTLAEYRTMLYALQTARSVLRAAEEEKHPHQREDMVLSEGE